MSSVGLLPAIALMAGAISAPALTSWTGVLIWLPALFCGGAIAAWRRGASRLTWASLALGFYACAAALASDAYEHALHTGLRAVLDREVGGFAVETLGPESDHGPIVTRAVLTEDASPRDGFVSLRARVVAVRVHNVWQPVDGGVAISVGGSVPVNQLLTWRAHRSIEAPMTFRRPARFLNDGVSNLEREAALDDITLFASIKSGRLVEIIAPGRWLDERAADVRAHVRQSLAQWVEPYDPVSSAIAAAVLIGDRTGLPDETRDALQAAGTYHVIAISGGNIAILAAVATCALALCGIRGRAASVLGVLVLVAYALIVTAGPSVWRATLMAIAYFVARAIDHRTPVWQAVSVAACVIVVLRPLDVSDPGFMLTFGATGALVEGARRGATLLPQSAAFAWVVATMVGSVAVEAALLPVSASAFSRVTSAGVFLNLLAVPAMGIVQIAALIVTCADTVPFVAGPAAWMTHSAAAALVWSAHLVGHAPWLTARVPPPGAVQILTYYVSLAAMVLLRGRVRLAGALVFVAALVSIGGGVDVARVWPRSAPHPLRLTVFDVGQGESMLLETPGGSSFLIDTGGAPFGSGVDIGRRVLAPALWARGVSSLDTLLVTHGDPDHVGGAMAVLEDFHPRRLWEGIHVPRHPPTTRLIDAARQRGTLVEALRASRDLRIDGLRIRVLHPPEPDWERRRVRNDDSVVLEVVYGEVSLLLTGDIGADIERSIAPTLTPVKTRILKVAHHGSRTSTSEYLLDAWRPQIAVISCGRGNRFGHPAPEVSRRLDAIGAKTLRTDRDGQITIETDGRTVRAATFVERSHD